MVGEAIFRSSEDVMTEQLSGRCFCGKVAWCAPGPVLWAGHCHCDSCRRATSAPFTSFFGVERRSITWTGELAAVKTSNGEVVRKFCPGCGSQMTIECGRWPTEAHLYAATLDVPTKFKPKAHFHYAEKLSWIEFADELPKYPGSADTTEPIVD